MVPDLVGYKAIVRVDMDANDVSRQKVSRADLVRSDSMDNKEDLMVNQKVYGAMVVMEGNLGATQNTIVFGKAWWWLLLVLLSM